MASIRETATVDDRGRLVLPRAWRDSLGLEPGASVVLENDGESIRVVNARREHAALVRSLRGSARSGPSVDDLIADRRAEAARDEAAE